MRIPFHNLPEVVLCPLRGLNAAKMIAEQVSPCVVDKIMTSFAVTTGWHKMTTSCNATTMETNVKAIMAVKNITDFKDFLLHYSYEVSEFLYEVKLPNETVLNESDISNMFYPIFGGFDAGICWTFTDRGSIVSWPNIGSGYAFFFKIPPRTKYDRHHSDGLMLGVSPKVANSPPNSFVRLAPNSMIDIELSLYKTERLKRLSWPKSGDLCDATEGHISSDDCYISQYLKAVDKYCSCLHYKQSVNKSFIETQLTCSPMQLDECLKTNSSSIHEYTITNQMKCKPVCRENVYSMTTSYGDYEPSFVKATRNLSSNYVRSGINNNYKQKSIP